MTLDPQQRQLKSFSFNQLLKTIISTFKYDIDHRTSLSTKVLPQLLFIIGELILINNSINSIQKAR